MKGQTVRLFDVFILGPLMVRAGWHIRNRPLGTFIAVSGVLTIIYNLKNYLEYEGSRTNGS